MTYRSLGTRSYALLAIHINVDKFTIHLYDRYFVIHLLELIMSRSPFFWYPWWLSIDQLDRVETKRLGR